MTQVRGRAVPSNRTSLGSHRAPAAPPEEQGLASHPRCSDPGLAASSREPRAPPGPRLVPHFLGTTPIPRPLPGPATGSPPQERLPRLLRPVLTPRLEPGSLQSSLDNYLRCKHNPTTDNGTMTRPGMMPVSATPAQPRHPAARCGRCAHPALQRRTLRPHR